MQLEYTENVKVASGLLRGLYDKENGVKIYKGIPYAAPPVGERRFKEPQEPLPWEGVHDCIAFGKSAIQKPMDRHFEKIWTEEFVITSREISEDCLTLNIWAKEKGEKMPVVLYLHGGGYSTGGSSCEIYDGTELAKKGIIYISMNHREAILGLMACKELSEESDSKTSGNYMLHDEIAALKWIKKNIAAFGGDPDNVTVWGQSSGAGETNALSISPLAKGLFRQVISMGLNTYHRKEFVKPWISLEEAYKDTEEILEEAGKSFEEYRNLPAEEYVKGREKFNLVIDGYSLTDYFQEGIDSGKSNHVGSMMGAVPGDSMMSLFLPFMIPNREIFIEKLKNGFGAFFDEADAWYHFSNPDIDMNALKNEIMDDLLIASMLCYADGRIQAGAKETYIYYFRHVMPGPYAKIFGAFHSSEVPYFMNYFSDKRKEYWTEEDYAIGKYVSTQLAGYVASGKVPDERWIPTDGNNYFLIDTREQKMVEFSREKKAFWKKVFSERKERLL